MNMLMEKLKEKNSKRFVENAVIFLILLVIVIIVINSLYGKEEKEEVVATNHLVVDQAEPEGLETKLSKILSMIEGAGKVNVMISYLSTEEQVPLYDWKENTTVTEEKDKEGGTRKTEQTSNEQSVIYEESNNQRTPVIKQTKMPEIIGVIVVAEGANNIKVKDNLIKAVEATVNVAAHRIQVFAKQK